MSPLGSSISYPPMDIRSLVTHRYAPARFLLTLTCSQLTKMPPKPVEDYRFFVALVMVEDGSIQVRSSQELKRFRGAILEDSHHRFKEVYSDYIEQPGGSTQQYRGLL